MAARFRVSSTHPEDLACGAVLAPGEASSRVRPSNPHDKRLIDEGRLVELAPRKARKGKKEEE